MIKRGASPAGQQPALAGDHVKLRVGCAPVGYT
jgi:hypothetical protein